MVAERKYIDLEDYPELAAVAEETAKSGEPIDLRKKGKTVAILTPEDPWKPGDPREMTAEDIAELMSTAGSWRGLIDADNFLADNAKSRRVSTRPEVILEIPD